VNVLVDNVLDNGDVTRFPVGSDRNNGVGVYTVNDEFYKTGVFENGVFVSGQFRKNNIVYKGTFSENSNVNHYLNSDDSDPVTHEVLCDDNGSIEWVLTGIVYTGVVKNDQVVHDENGLALGTYSVPKDTIVSYHGGKGSLTFNSDEKTWTVVFPDGFYIKSITSSEFDPYTIGFMRTKRIVFSDGCISDYRKSYNRSGYRNTYHAPITGFSIKKWSNHQLDLWLRAVYRFSEDVHDNISIYNITGSQWIDIDETVLWDIGLDVIEIAQVVSDRTDTINTQWVHNTTQRTQTNSN
jgi:hypothetical protein